MVAEPIHATSAIQVVDAHTGVLTRADEWNQRRVEFVRQHLCGGAPDAEASAFIEICKRRGLAPEEKQVYLIKRRTKDENGKFIDVWTPQTGIDGYRLMADRSGKYAGSDDPIYRGESSFITGKDDWKKEIVHPETATVTVWKIVDGTRCPFSATARWSEYYPGEKQGKFWHTMPYQMLGKCAESLALRKAFPADLSGIYTNEEMDQANRDVIEGSSRVVEKPVAITGGASEEQLKKVGALARQRGLGKKADFLNTVGKALQDLTPDECEQLIATWSEPDPEPEPDDSIEAEYADVDDEPDALSGALPGMRVAGASGSDKYTA